VNSNMYSAPETPSLTLSTTQFAEWFPQNHHSIVAPLHPHTFTHT